jgi:hypothetical protein
MSRSEIASPLKAACIWVHRDPVSIRSCQALQRKGEGPVPGLSVSGSPRLVWGWRASGEGGRPAAAGNPGSGWGWRRSDGSGGIPYPPGRPVDRSIGIQRMTASFCPGAPEPGTRVLLECPGTLGPWTGRPDLWGCTVPLRSGPGLTGQGLRGSGRGLPPSAAGATRPYRRGLR